MKPKYDSTVARIAGNILSGVDLMVSHDVMIQQVRMAVAVARGVVEEVKRTQPDESES